MADVLAVGEAMVELRPANSAPDSHTFSASVAGDVFNASACLSRLGTEVLFFQKVAEDAFAPLFRQAFAREGMLDGLITATGRNGLYYHDPDAGAGGAAGLTYWRDRSAASATLDETTFPLLAEEARRARIFLTSGITLAVQERRDLLHGLAAEARDAGARVCFMVNARTGLNHLQDGRLEEVTLEEFLAEVLAFLGDDDVVFASDDDLHDLGADAWQLAGHHLGRPGAGVEQGGSVGARSGGRLAFVTSGSEGALAITSDGSSVEVRPPRGVEVADTLGAGDALVAGAIFAMAGGAGPEDCCKSGVALASTAVAGKGALHDGIRPDAFREALARLA